LAQGAGKYRCGKCRQLNNALESLFDEWPDPGDHATAAAELPILGINLDLVAAERTRLSPGEASIYSEEDAGEEQGTRRSNKTLRVTWIATAITLLIIVAAYLADFFRQPLLHSPGDGEALVETGLKKQSPAALPGNLDLLELLSRDMRSHPTRPDALRLSLTIVNRAPISQTFPKLEVILLDSSGQTLVSRLFEPQEYLAQDADIKTGMTPQAYLHINLDLADPGSQAVGFELHFR